MDTYDIIIVGAGTAGCALANRLSADAGLQVLLLEAGGRDTTPWVHIPVGYLYCIGNPRTDWCYRTQPEPGLNGRVVGYPRGRVLGGSSAINGMIYMRGQREDYDGWADLTGDAGWCWEQVLPYFKRSEDYHLGADALHGAGGEWRVEAQRLRWDILEDFMQAAVQSGIPACRDFNRGDNFGVGYFEVNQKSGWRWHAGKAFLRPVRTRANLRIATRAQVAHLLINEERRCTGVQLLNGRVLHARREVVLCAGAINTPQLLERSGVGEPARLREAGIAARHALPGVGANLQDHLQLRVVVQVTGTQTLNSIARSWRGKLGIALQYLLHRSGPMSMAPSQLGVFAMSDAAQSRPNLEFHVQPLSLPAFGQPLHDFDAITASVCNLRPSSRGSVHAASPEPNTPPLIAPNYLATSEDQRIAADALRLVRRIVAAPALARYQPREYWPGETAQDQAALIKAAGDIGTTIFHPVGTCAMGNQPDAGAVVDARLRVHGMTGLRIVDASVMPTITSGNTNAPTLMIAERAADLMRDDYRAGR